MCLGFLRAGGVDHAGVGLDQAVLTSGRGAVVGVDSASRGYPRTINNLAINALTSASARNSSLVDEEAARIAISEAGAD